MWDILGHIWDILGHMWDIWEHIWDKFWTHVGYITMHTERGERERTRERMRVGE